MIVSNYDYIRWLVWWSSYSSLVVGVCLWFLLLLLLLQQPFALRCWLKLSLLAQHKGLRPAAAKFAAEVGDEKMIGEERGRESASQEEKGERKGVGKPGGEGEGASFLPSFPS